MKVYVVWEYAVIEYDERESQLDYSAEEISKEEWEENVNDT